MGGDHRDGSAVWGVGLQGRHFPLACSGRHLVFLHFSLESIISTHIWLNWNGNSPQSTDPEVKITKGTWVWIQWFWYLQSWLHFVLPITHGWILWILRPKYWIINMLVVGLITAFPLYTFDITVLLVSPSGIDLENYCLLQQWSETSTLGNP